MSKKAAHEHFQLLPIFYADRHTIPCAPRTWPDKSRRVEIVSLGRYKIFRFPKVIRDALGAKTTMIPRPRGFATIGFVLFCYVVLEVFAEVFAGRELTGTRLFWDGLLALSTVAAGLATAMTDPGIIPPHVVEYDFEDDDHGDVNNSATVMMMRQDSASASAAAAVNSSFSAPPGTSGSPVMRSPMSSSIDAGAATATRSAAAAATTTTTVNGTTTVVEITTTQEGTCRRSVHHRRGLPPDNDPVWAERFAAGSPGADKSADATEHNSYLAAVDPNYEATEPFELGRCKYCDHLRPRQAAHCPKCGTCIDGFDHHCGFLSCDIGRRNLRYFCMFIVLSLCCISHGAIAILKPIVVFVVFNDVTLLDSAKYRSNAALGLMGAALICWAVLMGYMVGNYLLMLFVPGAASTREVWRRLCGKGGGASNSSNSSSTPEAPLPSWHPGYQRQQREMEENQKRTHRLRFWDVFFGIPASLLPRWCRDVVKAEFEEKGEQAAGADSSSDDDDANMSDSANERKELITV